MDHTDASAATLQRAGHAVSAGQDQASGHSHDLADLIKREAPPANRPLVNLSDIPLVAWLLVATVAGSVLPWKAGFALGRMAAAVSAVLPHHRRLAAKMKRAFGLDKATASAMMRRQINRKFDNSIAFFRDVFHHDGRTVTMYGLEHLWRAHKRGKGVVIWMADMASASDAAQLGFCQAGFPLAHMTRPEHGFSMSRFGMAVLNPLKRAHERRFLSRHIMYDRANPAEALDAMAQVLRSGGLLSVLATTYEGRTLAEADFLGGRCQVAAGPPRIALDAGCPILPLFVIADVAHPGHYRCELQAPLAMPGRDRTLAVRAAAADYLHRLEQVVRDHPAAWRGWGDLHYPA